MPDPVETKFVVAFYDFKLTPGSRWLKEGFRHVVTYQHLGRDPDSKRFEWIREQRRFGGINRGKMSHETSNLPDYLKSLPAPGGVTVYETEQSTPGWFQVWFPQPGGVGTAKKTLGITAWGMWTPWDLARYIEHSNSKEAVRALRNEKIGRIFLTASIAGPIISIIALYAINNLSMPDLSISRPIEASISETKDDFWLGVPKLKPDD